MIMLHIYIPVHLHNRKCIYINHCRVRPQKKYLYTYLHACQTHAVTEQTWTRVDMEHASIHVNSCLCPDSFVIGWVARVLEVQELRNANRHHNTSTDQSQTPTWICSMPKQMDEICFLVLQNRHAIGDLKYKHAGGPSLETKNMSSISHTLHKVSTWRLGCMKKYFCRECNF